MAKAPAPTLISIDCIYCGIILSRVGTVTSRRSAAYCDVAEAMSKACYCRLDDSLLEGLEKGSDKALKKLNAIRAELVKSGDFIYPEWLREVVDYPIPMQARVRIANARRWIKKHTRCLDEPVYLPLAAAEEEGIPIWMSDDRYLNEVITKANLPEFCRRTAFRIKRVAGLQRALETVTAWIKKENADGIQDEGSLQNTISR